MASCCFRLRVNYKPRKVADGQCCSYSTRFKCTRFILRTTDNAVFNFHSSPLKKSCSYIVLLFLHGLTDTTLEVSEVVSNNAPRLNFTSNEMSAVMPFSFTSTDTETCVNVSVFVRVCLCVCLTVCISTH